MERLGIPTASIITHVFLNTANAMTRMMGVPGFDALSSLTDQECRDMASTIAPNVESILLGANGGQEG